MKEHKFKDWKAWPGNDNRYSQRGSRVYLCWWSHLMPAGRIGEISLHAVSCLVRLRLKNLLSITIAINAWPGISFNKVLNVFSGRLKVLDLQLNCLNKASIKSNDVKYNLRWIEHLEYLPRIFGNRYGWIQFWFLWRTQTQVTRSLGFLWRKY